MSRLSPAVLALLAADLLLLVQGLQPGWAQDFLPFYAAADLVAQGHTQGIYLTHEARHLFDADPALVEASMAAAGDEASRDAITAFVAPPPALLVVFPFLALPYPTAAFVWRLLLAIAAIAAIHTVHARLERIAPERATLWAAGLLLFVPVVGYAVSVGQTSVLLLTAAVLLPDTAEQPNRERALAAFIAAIIALKMFPVVLLAFLVLLGRWRTAAWALGVLAVWTVGAFLVVPISLVPDFVEAVRQLGRHVITDWNNVGVEAMLVRHTSGEASAAFQLAPAWVSAAALVVKGVVLGLCSWVASGRSDATEPQRWAAAWVGTLALTPLLWAHYLVVLPVLLLPVFAHPRRSVWRMVASLGVLAGTGAWVVVAATKALPAIQLGDLGTGLWTVTMVTVLVDALAPKPAA